MPRALGLVRTTPGPHPSGALMSGISGLHDGLDQLLLKPLLHDILDHVVRTRNVLVTGAPSVDHVVENSKGCICLNKILLRQVLCCTVRRVLQRRRCTGTIVSGNPLYLWLASSQNLFPRNASCRKREAVNDVPPEGVAEFFPKHTTPRCY